VFLAVICVVLVSELSLLLSNFSIKLHENIG
jgi:hypothetical protein